MTLTTRSSLLGLLLVLAAITGASPALAATGGENPGGSAVDERLERITRALRQRSPHPAPPADGEALLARGFINGSRGGAYRGPAGRGFVNGHGYYGGSRTFVNGRGGYPGGFANGAYGRGFVNW
ncbi:MAG: GrrA/OscA1 family cyclophane-containing rSAM-modified RiPP [Synechococcaceae cyanobacterium]|nr:GrrA/OscA1 family cyclophane-containing rSAM-modified RiPP [Synechococcaceae cyanobacterium]